MLLENPGETLRLIIGTVKTLRSRIAEAGGTLHVLEVDTLLNVAGLVAEIRGASKGAGD